MENNVIQLEAGNLEADDSEIKQKYDNQKQLNIQLAEQKRWLEHELEQIKLKARPCPFIQIIARIYPFLSKFYHDKVKIKYIG